MITGSILRRLVLPYACLLGALLTGCSSVRSAPAISVLEQPAESPTPGLALASYRPSALRAEDQDDGDWRVIRDEVDTKSFARSGLSFSLKTTLSDLLGDFDGNQTYQNSGPPPNELLFVPDTDASAGIGFDIGMRWERYEMLFSWQETEYDADFGGAGKDTTISYIDLLFREYFWIDSHIQPFLVAGLGVSEANISGGAQDAALNLSTGELRDGINYNVGAGLAIFASPRLSVFGQLMYRFGRYETVGLSSGKITADPVLDSDSWELSMGVSFNLLNPWD